MTVVLVIVLVIERLVSAKFGNEYEYEKTRTL
jgi:hypothetical protein